MNTRLNPTRIISFAIAILVSSLSHAQNLTLNEYKLFSPNSTYEIVLSQVSTGNSTQLLWSVRSKGQTILAPSLLSLSLQSGEVLGHNGRIANVKREAGSLLIPAPLYKKASVALSYTQMKITFRDNWGIIFRAFDDGVAYRFFTTRKGELVVMDETAQFNFPANHSSLVAYNTARDYDRFASAYQSIYTSTTLGEVDPSKTVLLPALVTVQAPSFRVVITEVDVEHYPGMFLEKATDGFGLHALFPKYPKEVMYHATRKQERVVSSEPYMSITQGTREFPWRLMVISKEDSSLLLSDLVYALAPAPDPQLYPITYNSHSNEDAPQISWIQPGKVAWDWWNDWRISGVDFVAGINTQTYKYYIDFACANGLENVILDEGWSPPKQGDVMEIIPQIDLPELIRYANSKNVGLILWVVWNVLDEKLEEACARYSEMGVKGFKIDFIDRADQKAIEFVPRASLMAAKYKLVVDFHGVSKPTGQNRTYPNALNFEGVYGLEELKWSNIDMPLYDVTWPFIRGLAGPADYTQGAMKNAAKDAFANIYNEPMSQGTRCHQMGSYMIFESPIAMLCDNPTNYIKEQECTNFIAKIPTTYDETVVVAAEVGEYIVMARRKGEVWYIGGLTNWTPRDLTLDLSFLAQRGQKRSSYLAPFTPEENKSTTFSAELFRDGVNAHRVGIDYTRAQIELTPTTFQVHLAPGGGFAMRVWENRVLSLTDTEWKLVELDGKPIETGSLAKPPFLLFESQSNRFYGNTGCNNISGSWKEGEQGKITFSQAISTRMMCINMDVENRFLQIFNSITGYNIKEDILTLIDDQGRILARFSGTNFN